MKGKEIPVRDRIMRSGGCFAVILLAVSLLSPSASAEDRRTRQDELTIMTLNTEFMWDGIAPEEGQVDFAWKNDPTGAALHMQRVAQIILASDPDIVHLAEVENRRAVEKLNTDYLNGRGYVVYFVKGKDTYTGQDVALLTRIDPGEFGRDNGKGQCGEISKGVSKNLYATFSICEDLKIALIGLHFLARPDAQDRRQERQAQADLIRRRAMMLAAQGYAPIIAGDFNDYDGSPESCDHIGSRPITNVLSMIREMDPSTDADDLFNAAERIPRAARYTAFWDRNDNGQIDSDRELTSIDHILISRSLSDRAFFCDIPHDHDPRQGPDHYPVVVRLKTGEPVAAAPRVKILWLLPDPDGSDFEKEAVALRNNTPIEFNLDFWTLRDLGGREWPLSGLILPPHQTLVIERNRRPMSLNNDGDTISLMSPEGLEDSVAYGPVKRGEIVYTSDPN